MVFLPCYSIFQFRFLETLTHLLRGNIGSGVFAMGDAFKNGGLILAGILTVTIGLVSVHSQHILVSITHKFCNFFHLIHHRKLYCINEILDDSDDSAKLEHE